MAQFIGARVSDELKARLDRITRAAGISVTDYLVGTIARQIEEDEKRYAPVLQALAQVARELEERGA